MNEIVGMETSKVPEITLGFWVIKIFATTLGEVGGNEVTLKLGLGYLVGTAIFSAALLVVLSAQIRAKRFHAFLYWAAITATTLTGTALADFFDRSLGIGYLGGSLSLFTPRGPRIIAVAGNRGRLWGEQHRIETRTKRNHSRVN